MNTHLERIRQCRNNGCKMVTMIFKYNLMLLVTKARIHEWQVEIFKLRNRVKNQHTNAMLKHFINNNSKKEMLVCIRCASTEILTFFYWTCIIWWIPISHHCWYIKNETLGCHGVSKLLWSLLSTIPNAFRHFREQSTPYV